MTMKDIRLAAQAEAKDKRAEFRKTPPHYATREQIIADMLRVAADPDLGTVGSCTRAKYRRYGWIPEREVTDVFGTHTVALKEAGLRTSATMAAEQRKHAKSVETAELSAAVLDQIMPHLAGPMDLPNDVEMVNVLVGSDFHSQDVDPFALSVFLDTALQQQPDFIVLNGDVLDAYSLGRYPSNPNRVDSFQDEIDFVVENIFAPLRENCPDARIILIIGNHEFRLVKFLVDNAKPLAGLRCLQFGELLELEKYGIELVVNDALLDPTPLHDLEPSKCYFQIGHHIFTHGTSIGRFPAADELNKWDRSGTSGHVHRFALHTESTPRCPNMNWMCLPMMAKLGHGVEFVDIPDKWDVGFGIVRIFPEYETSVQIPVLCTDVAVVDGWVYHRADWV